MRRQRKVRVLMLCENSYYPHDPRVRREAQALLAAGYQVTVIFPARSGQPMREIVDGVHVYRYPGARPRRGALGYVWEYGYSLAATLYSSLWVYFREGFDVIHAANPPDIFVLVAALYKLLGKRFVYDHHDLAPEMYQARFGKWNKGLVYRAQVALEKLSCRLADHVIATNESYKQIEMTRGGVPEERITVVRNGPEPELLRGMEPDPSLKEPGKCLIVYAGVMGPQDGVDYLVRALGHLRYDLNRSDFSCVLVGGVGDARESLRRQVSELGLEEHVRFTGWVSAEDWNRYLASADICVAPDPSNPFTDRSTMIKVTEYMGAGKPIVAFDLKEHRFSAQQAALFVPPNDEMEMARAIATLMDDPERRAEMGAFGRHRVREDLAWRHSVPRLLQAYDRMLHQGREELLPAQSAVEVGEEDAAA